MLMVVRSRFRQPVARGRRAPRLAKRTETVVGAGGPWASWARRP